jgi:hypothetical protein
MSRHTITQIFFCVKTSVEHHYFPEFEGMIMSVVYSQHPISTLSLHLKIPQYLAQSVFVKTILRHVVQTIQAQVRNPYT